MGRRAKAGITAALVFSFVVAGLLPLTLLALPNPPEYQDVEALDESGAYAADDGRLVRLYPHPRKAEEFPEEAASIGAEAVLLVQSRRYDVLTRYVIRSFDNTRELATDRFVDEENVLHLVSAEQPAPGEYVLESVEDSMYGDPEYYYFRVDGE